ncbi:Protein QUIRKY [Vitis vinifera]|uniref:Protein QUIRKY n=1 Tax=Vitis vinifera TaxID=29760 RepID=A0A438I0U3_VITVI|nr:Protein QUIRKY [Vitis vinifera]
MVETCSRKLVVEICNAKNLMPKDGQGTASAYVIVDFDGQRRRTKTKFRDLNPQWDETLEFLVQDPESMASEILEINVYNDKKTGKRTTFLGKVKIAGSTFAKAGSEDLVYYPLEKRSVFSQIKGEIGLKISYVDEDVPPEPEKAAAEEKKPDDAAVAPSEQKTDDAAAAPAATEEKAPEKEEEKKADESNKEAADQKPAEPPKDEKAEEAPAAAASPPAEVENPPVAHTEKAIQTKETTETEKRPDLGVSDLELRSLAGDRGRRAYDLVDRMPFLYVRVVKAKGANSEAESTVYAKLVIGTHSVRTKSKSDKDWIRSLHLTKKASTARSAKRVPPDSPLAPQWYTLEDSSENSPGNDIMLAVWIGTQADEAFQEAWQSDSGGLIPETRAKVYLSPKLWYLRLTVIQSQDLQLGSGPEAKAKGPELYVKAQLGAQVFKTARTSIGSSNPTWNEDLLFVAAEPFEQFLVMTVEDVTSGQPVGHAKVHVPSLDRRTDDRTESKSRWFNLVGDEKRPYAGRIHVRACLEGGYHVLDEAAHVTSDVRASAKQLAKPPIGLLEVGIRGATNLLPVKSKDGTRGTTDAYVVAKYGPKWVRTRTILDRFNPRWNEQYTWDVYDPCTDGEDTRTALDARYESRVHKFVLPDGAASRWFQENGEIEIAVRFSCSSWLNLIQAYASPMLPRMHYVRPLGPAQQDILRHTAMRIVTARLARSEPALGQEVVQYMLDSDTHVWSMRRSKANWFRVLGWLSRAATLARWLDGIRTWVHPPTTILMHVFLVAVILCPHLVLPTVFMYAFFIIVLRFRYRRRVLLSMDTRLSYAEAISADELDEEFDSFPTIKSRDQVRQRYDRLRILAGRAQTLLGDVAAQGERLEALFNWRDPRATGLFVVFCLVASLVFYTVPFRAFVLGWGFYYLRHPRFRGDMPSVPFNFFRRLPSLSDQIL